LLTTFWELTTFWDGFDRETLLVEEAHHDASIGTNAASGPHGGRGDDLKRAPFLRCAKNVAEALLSRDQTMVWLNSTLIATSSLPYDRHEAADTTLSRRACTAPLSQRGRTLHRLQALRADLPGAMHCDRGWTPSTGRHAPRHALRHRYAQVHLLWAMPVSVSRRRHRGRAQLRICDRDARGTLLRQATSPRQWRSLGAGNRPSARARRAVKAQQPVLRRD